MSETKKLGFGLMRLPKIEGTQDIDVEQVKVMVDKFLEAGFTYFDTAWAYAGSEDAIRQALVERYPRDSYTLATKIAPWINCKTKEEAEAQFDTSLRQTGVEYFDYYLLHNLGQGRTKWFDEFDIWNFVSDLKAKGKVKNMGFSFHSTPEELEPILKAHPEVDFIQLQINYADWESHEIQSKEVYEMAKKYGKPIVVMEPVKGGMLANPPEQVAKIFTDAEPDMSVASWAVRFAADLPGVMMVLSGMSNVEQMEDNISYMKDFTGLTDEERAVIEKAREELAKIELIPCTKCDYCYKVCPVGVGIWGTFMAMNTYTLYKDLEFAKGRQGWHVSAQGRELSSECIKCGACEEACPQHINIRERLEEATELFGNQ